MSPTPPTLTPQPWLSTIQNLEGLVSLVTGGASGLGRGTVERFIKEGARVVICDLPQSNGQTLAEDLGENAVFAPCDVSSEKDVISALELCHSKFNELNVLVNCAGIDTAKRIYNDKKEAVHSLEEFTKVQKVNVGGTFNTIRLATELMYQNSRDEDGQRGVIINTASIAAYDGQIGQVAYSASNGAIVAMTLPAARDLASYGIRVVTIAPGLFRTPLTESLPEKIQTHMASIVPFPQRFGEPDEFGHLVQVIVLNKMLNGETIRLDGALRLPP